MYKRSFCPQNFVGYHLIMFFSPLFPLCTFRQGYREPSPKQNNGALKTQNMNTHIDVQRQLRWDMTKRKTDVEIEKLL